MADGGWAKKEELLAACKALGDAMTAPGPGALPPGEYTLESFGQGLPWRPRSAAPVRDFDPRSLYRHRCIITPLEEPDMATPRLRLLGYQPRGVWHEVVAGLTKKDAADSIAATTSRLKSQGCTVREVDARENSLFGVMWFRVQFGTPVGSNPRAIMDEVFDVSGQTEWPAVPSVDDVVHGQWPSAKPETLRDMRSPGARPNHPAAQLPWALVAARMNHGHPCRALVKHTGRPERYVEDLQSLMAALQAAGKVRGQVTAETPGAVHFMPVDGQWETALGVLVAAGLCAAHGGLAKLFCDGRSGAGYDGSDEGLRFIATRRRQREIAGVPRLEDVGAATELNLGQHFRIENIDDYGDTCAVTLRARADGMGALVLLTGAVKREVWDASVKRNTVEPTLVGLHIPLTAAQVEVMLGNYGIGWAAVEERPAQSPHKASSDQGAEQAWEREYEAKMGAGGPTGDFPGIVRLVSGHTLTCNCPSDAPGCAPRETVADFVARSQRQPPVGGVNIPVRVDGPQELVKIGQGVRRPPGFSDAQFREYLRRGSSAPERPPLFWRDNTGALCAGDPPEGFLGTERILTPEAVCDGFNAAHLERDVARDALCAHVTTYRLLDGPAVMAVRADTREEAGELRERIAAQMNRAARRGTIPARGLIVLLPLARSEGFDLEPVDDDALARAGLVRLTDAERAVVEAMRKGAAGGER